MMKSISLFSFSAFRCRYDIIKTKTILINIVVYHNNIITIQTVPIYSNNIFIFSEQKRYPDATTLHE